MPRGSRPSGLWRALERPRGDGLSCRACSPTRQFGRPRSCACSATAPASPLPRRNSASAVALRISGETAIANSPPRGPAPSQGSRQVAHGRNIEGARDRGARAVRSRLHPAGGAASRACTRNRARNRAALNRADLGEVGLVDHAHLAAAVALDAQEPRREGAQRLAQGFLARRQGFGAVRAPVLHSFRASPRWSRNRLIVPGCTGRSEISTFSARGFASRTIAIAACRLVVATTHTAITGSPSRSNPVVTRTRSPSPIGRFRGLACARNVHRRRRGGNPRHRHPARRQPFEPRHGIAQAGDLRIRSAATIRLRYRRSVGKSTVNTRGVCTARPRRWRRRRPFLGQIEVLLSILWAAN